LETEGGGGGGRALSWTCLAVDLAVSRRWTAGASLAVVGKGNAPCPSPSVGGRPDRLRMISLMGLGSFEILGLNGLDMGWTTWPLLRPIQNKVIWEGSESLFAAWLVIPNGLGI